MYENTLPRRIESVRRGAIAVLERLAEQGRTLQLPAPPATLESCRLKLVNNDYQVLVAGEAKRGKSTFVNALLGEDLLPTAVDVATCQVFRLSRATQEDCRLRFEDGSYKKISRADLERYGSQVMADAGRLPSLDRIIRWIEVDFPTRFLPKGVRLLDTPGLGSLYAAHAQITQRFVPFADAVIFVLDSEGTIIQPEIAFIQAILRKTPHIFFIQTKIDKYRRDQWQNLLVRNQDILEEHFSKQLTDTRIWPISSSYLLKARQEEDGEDYKKFSRYPQFASVLQIFLFHVAGWDRAAAAMRAAEDYYILARRTLAGRLAAIQEESTQKRGDIQQRIAQRKQQFEREWGVQGQKHEELLMHVREVAGAGKLAFLQEFQSNGAIETAQRAKIEALETVEKAQQYNNTLDEQVSDAFQERWKQTRERVFAQWSTLLGPFLDAANSLSFTGDTTRMTTRHTRRLNIKQDWAGIIGQANKESAWVSTLLGFFMPATFANLAALFCTGVRALIIGKTALLESARQELHQRLDEVLQEVQQQYLGPDARYGYQNYIDGYFDAQVRSISEKMQQLVARKSAEAQVEIDRLAEEARLDEQERQARSEQTQRDLAAWDAIDQDIQKVAFSLEVLEQSMTILSERDLAEQDL